MKRVLAACLLQTLRFSSRDDTMGYEAAVKTAQDELAHYKKQLERGGTAYVIDEETIQPDGSVIIKIRKQYNSVKTGDYFA